MTNFYVLSPVLIANQSAFMFIQVRCCLKREYLTIILECLEPVVKGLLGHVLMCFRETVNQVSQQPPPVPRRLLQYDLGQLKEARRLKLRLPLVLLNQPI